MIFEAGEKMSHSGANNDKKCGVDRYKNMDGCT